MFSRLQGFKEELEKLSRFNPKIMLGAGSIGLAALGIGGAKMEKKRVSKIKDNALQQGYELGREHEQYLENQGW